MKYISALMLFCNIFQASASDVVYYSSDTILLSYTRVVAGVKQTGLTPTVTVVNAKTNASLLASTSLAESAAGSGVYQFSWAHGLTANTECLVKYVNGSLTQYEFIMISTDLQGGRTN